MAPSETAGPMERGLTFATGGAVMGGLIGMLSAGYSKPAVMDVPAMTYVSKTAAGHAAGFAAVAATFAVTDTLLTQTRGHSVANTAAAGCAAGAVLGAQQGSPAKMGFACLVFGGIQAVGARSRTVRAAGAAAGRRVPKRPLSSRARPLAAPAPMPELPRRVPPSWLLPFAPPH